MTRKNAVRSRLGLACAIIGMVGVFTPAAQAVPSTTAVSGTAAADAVVAEGEHSIASTVKAYYDVNLVAAPRPSEIVGYATAGTLLESPRVVRGGWYPGTTCGNHQDSDTWTEVFVPGTQRLAYAPSYCVG